MNSLTLVRGLPGSGKSTLAERLTANDDNARHLEADMYFMVGEVYCWSADVVGSAHAWCQNMTKEYLRMEHNVVVSNTFTTIAELRPYFKIAKKHNIVPQVVVCQNQFGNTHAVPELTLAKMHKRFQTDITQLFEEFK